MRVAIAGPDGAGKSSICAILKESYPQAEIVYAGKSNFRLGITKFALKVLIWAQKNGRFASFLAKHFIYYPIEYLDNLIKFFLVRDKKKFVLFDRHPIDRVIMLHTLKLRRAAKRVTLFNYILEYPLLWFWGNLYKALFPKIDIIFVLIPSHYLCFERANGQYIDMIEAEIRVKSYLLAANELRKFQNVCPLQITEKDTLYMLSSQIQGFIKSKLI